MKQIRTKWLIKPDVQIFLVTRFLLINLFSMTCVLIVSTLFFRHLVQTGVDAGLPPSHIYFEFIKNQSASYTYWWAGICLVTVIATIFCGFFFSNRFAGPIHSILMSLRDFNNNGRPIKEVKLRKNDLLQDLAEELNKLNTKV